MKHFNHFKADISGIKVPEKFTFPFYYEPHQLSKIAVAELQQYLENQTDFTHNFGINKNEKETIVYKFDTLSGNYLKVADMKLYVYGERDAHLSYNSHFANALGLAVGGATGYLMHKDQSFFYIATPFLYTTLTLPFGTSVKHEKQP